VSTVPEINKGESAASLNEGGLLRIAPRGGLAGMPLHLFAAICLISSVCGGVLCFSILRVLQGQDILNSGGSVFRSITDAIFFIVLLVAIVIPPAILVGIRKDQQAVYDQFRLDRIRFKIEHLRSIASNEGASRKATDPRNPVDSPILFVDDSPRSNADTAEFVRINTSTKRLTGWRLLAVGSIVVVVAALLSFALLRAVLGPPPG